jgi:NAD(P)-dependent dehydrogenase (short-subunit alcohol dehydrogenase family)
MEPNTLPIHYAELEAVFARTLGNGTRALAVASAVGGEGATTLARALAERAAASGKRTLLVDLNLEHPSLHRHYALGRSDWSPEATPDRQAILPSDVEGLCVLPAPTQVSEHWGFRDPATLRATLERWLVQFDRVVVDTSPLTRRNRRNVPADTVCGACRKTLLVVLAGQRADARDAPTRPPDAAHHGLAAAAYRRFRVAQPADLSRPYPARSNSTRVASSAGSGPTRSRQAAQAASAAASRSTPPCATSVWARC